MFHRFLDLRALVALAVLASTGCASNLSDYAEGGAALTLTRPSASRVDVLFELLLPGRSDCPRVRHVDATLDELPLTLEERGGKVPDLLGDGITCGAVPQWSFSGSADEFYGVDGTSTIALAAGGQALRFEIDDLRTLPGATFVTPPSGVVEPGDEVELQAEPAGMPWEPTPPGDARWLLESDADTLVLCAEGAIYVDCANATVTSTGPRTTLQIPDLCAAGDWAFTDGWRRPSVRCLDSAELDCAGDSIVEGPQIPVTVAFPTGYAPPPCGSSSATP